MAVTTIAIPRDLVPDQLIPFSIALRDTELADGYVLDFTRVGLTEPFGMLFLAALIRQFARDRRTRQGREISIRVSNYKSKTYASFMGLFKSFGLDYGKEPGEASGSRTYIPLTRLAISVISRDAREEHRRDQEIIEQESKRIADILTRNDDGPVTEALAYSICELMRNVVEHGSASHIWYAAQYWPSKGRVEFSILDEGVGLTRSLKRNPKLVVTDDEDAINQALKPGVSGIPKRRRVYDGDWANSGYGLYMTSSMCQQAGDFLICNYSRALQLSAEGRSILVSAFDGVAVRMVLEIERIQDLNDMLKKYRAAVGKPQ